jgi:hypothetical protein
MRSAKARSPLMWMAFASALLCVLLAGLFLVPFSHLWGVTPTAQPAPAQTASAPPDVSGSLVVALVFGVPALVPLALLISTRWARPGVGLSGVDRRADPSAQ